MATLPRAAIGGIPETGVQKTPRRLPFQEAAAWGKRKPVRKLASGNILAHVLGDDFLQLLDVAGLQRIDHVEVLARRDLDA